MTRWIGAVEAIRLADDDAPLAARPSPVRTSSRRKIAKNQRLTSRPGEGDRSSASDFKKAIESLNETQKAILKELQEFKKLLATQQAPRPAAVALPSAPVDISKEPFHKNAEKAAEAAHCAGEQGKFWDMHDRLFANQQNIAAAAPANLPLPTTDARNRKPSQLLISCRGSSP